MNMSIDLTLLIIAQMVIDVLVIVAIGILLHRLRRMDTDTNLETGIDALETVLTEADRVSGKFKEQLSEKQVLAKNIVEKLDEKMMRLNLLLNQADMTLAGAADNDAFRKRRKMPDRHRQQILELAKSGRKQADIARRLSIPKEQVQLVLDLKHRLAR